MLDLIPQYTELVNVCNLVLSYKGQELTFESGKLLMAQNTTQRCLGLLIETEELNLAVGSSPIHMRVNMACRNSPKYVRALKLYQNEGEILLFQYKMEPVFSHWIQAI